MFFTIKTNDLIIIKHKIIKNKCDNVMFIIRHKKGANVLET